jgi:signal transduction histidine kinase
MGLAIIPRIVKAHGGQIWAAPNTPRGAKFEFRLPTETPELQS